MTREQKINMLVDQVLEYGVSDTWVDGFKEGLKVMYDATTIDFKLRTCENCKSIAKDSSKYTCKIGVSSDMYFGSPCITKDFGCNKFERKQNEN